MFYGNPKRRAAIGVFVGVPAMALVVYTFWGVGWFRPLVPIIITAPAAGELAVAGRRLIKCRHEITQVGSDPYRCDPKSEDGERTYQSQAPAGSEVEVEVVLGGVERRHVLGVPENGGIVRVRIEQSGALRLEEPEG